LCHTCPFGIGLFGRIVRFTGPKSINIILKVINNHNVRIRVAAVAVAVAVAVAAAGVAVEVAVVDGVGRGIDDVL
jgi:hypothetical protein